MTSKKITKAVFPVAGLGTRFLPATKANPKEMLPIVDKPLIQYAVEEAIAAGITEMIFVTSSTKRAIEDHFDRDVELEQRLANAGKKKLLETIENIIPKGISCVYVRQAEQLGLGHAIACAQPLINDEPFAVLLADDLIAGQKCLTEMVKDFNQWNASVVAVNEVGDDETEQYGIVDLQGADLHQPIKGIVEKPKVTDAPSRLGVVGRYILTPEIFTYLQRRQTGVGGEIQLTDALAALLQQQFIYVHRINGTRYDCGSKLGYLKAMVDFGLKHPEIHDEFSAFLKAKG